MVDEGIAQFGTKSLDPGFESIPNAYVCDETLQLPESLFKILPRVSVDDERKLYRTGYCLVKPILEQGFADGVLKLMQNSMRSEDLQDLKGYQDRILSGKSLTDEEGRQLDAKKERQKQKKIKRQ